MTELLSHVTSPVTVYLLLLTLLAVDAFVPVVPAQALMITSGALTVYGDLSLPGVIAVGAFAVFTGDLACYLLGRSAGRNSSGGRLATLRRRCLAQARSGPGLTRRARARRAAARATRGLHRPGPMVLLLCRFVPGGRIAAGYRAGRLRYPARRFVAYDGGAALVWAAYGGMVGHLGGIAMTQSAWRLFAVAAVAATVFGAAGWVLALAGGRPAATPDRATSTDAPPPPPSRTATDRS